MRQCWYSEPDDRPTFKELCSSISKCMECIAGYLQFDFNPFTGGGEGEGEGGKGGEGEGGKGGEVGEEKVDNVAIQVIPPSVPADTVFTSTTTQ